MSGQAPVLITGGAGFIATNVAHRMLSAGRPVIVFDNLSRDGAAQNLEWLQAQHPDADLLEVALGDVRDADALGRVVPRASHVCHCAAQAAVTTSLDNPMADFEVNAGGTLTLLEVIRRCEQQPSLLFTSTNKVYGTLDHVPLSKTATRYRPADPYLRRTGIDEQCGLDLHSPYGCSKGAADQYVLDYARTFGLRTVVFRMSCVYGPHQLGTEDQGWVAHFLFAALAGDPLTIYGDGLQVRDVLFVDDLVEAVLLAEAAVDGLAGEAFNIGGGPANSTSLLELAAFIGELTGVRLQTRFAPWRRADQRYYVSDTNKFRDATGWHPRVGVRDGVRRLHEWLLDHRAPARGVRAGQIAS